MKTGKLRFAFSVIETKIMAKSKLKNTAITANDLTDFVANNSDFDFEMRVLEKLRSLNFACEYSGTYQDPVTDKVRQFDIRARKMQGVCTLAVAVECKNLRPTNPLLLSAVPRTATEAAHDLLLVRRQHGPAYPRVETIKGASAAYKESQMVGKKTDQVGRVESTGELSSDDAETCSPVLSERSPTLESSPLMGMAGRRRPPQLASMAPLFRAEAASLAATPSTRTAPANYP